jgi:hypothetical protein
MFLRTNGFHVRRLGFLKIRQFSRLCSAQSVSDRIFANSSVHDAIGIGGPFRTKLGTGRLSSLSPSGPTLLSLTNEQREGRYARKEHLWRLDWR